jgi:putative transposase
MTGKTKYDLDRGNHVVYSLHYHIIFVIKYRRKALYNDKIRERLKEIFRDLASNLKATHYDKDGKRIEEPNPVEIVSMEAASDHVHLLIKGTPQTDLVNLVNIFKGVSSRYLRQEFPDIKNLLWGDSFWSDSKFIMSTGQVGLDVLMKYVESQNEPKKK